MVDRDLEVPEADAAEQAREVEPEPARHAAPEGALPLDANEADVVEQAAEVAPDDDGYR